MRPEFIRYRADFDRLVTVNVTPESPVLEFKREIKDWRVDNAVKNPEREERKREARLEFVRDVVQLGNANGGCLVIGVNEVKTAAGKVAGTTNPVPAGDVQELIQWMHEALGRHASPNTFEPESIVEIEDGSEGGKIIAINVTPSPVVVGIWDDARRSFQVPIRRGTAKYLMNPDEMMRARMDNGRAAKLKLEELLSDEGKRRLVSLVDGIWFRSGGQLGRGPSSQHGKDIQIAGLYDDTFHLNVPIFNKPYTFSIPYAAIELLWLDESNWIGLVMKLRIVMETNENVFLEAR